jgi:hypothetical protein
MTPAPGDTPFHQFVDTIVPILLSAVVGFLGWLVKQAIKVAKTTNETSLAVINIRDNHLKHMADDITETKNGLIELRGQFIDHLQTGKN